MPVRTHAFPSHIVRPFSLARTDALLKAHPLYAKAKAGCAEAAVDLVADIALPFIAQISSQLPSNAWCRPFQAKIPS